LRSLSGHQAYVSSVVFLGEGQVLASGSEDQTITLWEPASGQVLRTLSGRQA
jgi:WD40 repeat protein